MNREKKSYSAPLQAQAAVPLFYHTDGFTPGPHHVSFTGKKFLRNAYQASSLYKRPEKGLLQTASVYRAMLMSGQNRILHTVSACT